MTHMIRLLSPAICFLLLASTANAQLPANLPTESECSLPWAQIIVVGDSFSSCAFDPGVKRGACWPERIRAATGCQVSNLAKGAGAALYWHTRTPISNAHCSPLFGPCLGIIWLGDVGEYTVFEAGATTAAEFQVHVFEQVVRLFGIGAVEVRIVRPRTDVFNPDSFVYREELSAKLQQLCDVFPAVSCIDMRDECGEDKHFPPGGVHPTAAGQKCIARAIRRELQ